MASLDNYLNIILEKGAQGMVIAPGALPEVWNAEGRYKIPGQETPASELETFISEMATEDDLQLMEETGLCEILFEYSEQYFNCKMQGGANLSIVVELVDPDLVRELLEDDGASVTMTSAEFPAHLKKVGPAQVEPEEPKWKIRPPVEHSDKFAAPKFEGIPDMQVKRGRNAIDEYLELMNRNNATDMHLTPSWSPTLRIDNLFRRSNLDPISPDQIRAMIYGILNTDDRKEFERECSVDLAYSLEGAGRFRMSCFNQLNGPALSIRHIPEEVPDIADLGLPSAIGELANVQSGMMLFCGPTGSGKSTTQAALVSKMNTEQARHIITLEDPIEYIHQSRNCLIQQREIGVHAPSFARGLRDALREDPDVIMVGEMRDEETISLALSASETGHLVLGTLHINTTTNSITRMVDAFSQHQQHGIRAQIAESLRAVSNQRLLTHARGAGMVPILELMKVNHAVASMIREEKLHQLVQVLTTGLSEGMFNFERSAAEALLDGRITREDAERVSPDKTVFKQILAALKLQRARKLEQMEGGAGARKSRPKS